jgi:hypothetical protein
MIGWPSQRRHRHERHARPVGREAHDHQRIVGSVSVRSGVRDNPATLFDVIYAGTVALHAGPGHRP